MRSNASCSGPAHMKTVRSVGDTPPDRDRRSFWVWVQVLKVMMMSKNFEVLKVLLVQLHSMGIARNALRK